MTQRTFATWVEPLAAANRESRSELVRVARQVPDAVWPQPSPLPGWSHKDLLAHLAGETEKSFLQILRAVVDRKPVDAALLGEADEKNARDVEARRSRSVEELIVEINADGEELMELLSRLTEEDENLRQEGIPMTLGEDLSNEPGGHHREHTVPLRAAVDSIML